MSEKQGRDVTIDILQGAFEILNAADPESKLVSKTRDPEEVIAPPYPDGVIFEQMDAYAFEGAPDCRNLAGPPIVIAKHGVNAKWCAEILQGGSPFGDGDNARVEVRPKRIYVVAQ
jgi:hypothetical protein